jgi:hypothetical protein
MAISARGSGDDDPARLSLIRTPKQPFAIGGGVSMDAWRGLLMPKPRVTITADERQRILQIAKIRILRF